MIKYFIKFDDESTLNVISQHGEITYRSPILNLIGIKTDTSKEELLNIEGVLSVNKERTGRLLPVRWD